MKLKLPKARTLILSALALVTVMVAAYPALATITVTPIMVVIQGRERYADVNLLNVGRETESYAMEWKFMRMVEGTGNYENVEAAITPNFDLSQNLAMTPRRVTIEPNGMQKIRLGLRLKGEPPAPGDYRAHLEMRMDTTEKENNTPLAKDQVRVGVQVNVGFSIPVIYRVGESDATVSIDDVSVFYDEKEKKLKAKVATTRSGGPFSILGHLIVYHNNKIVGEIRNANIFPEVNKRVYDIPLTESSLSGGNIRVVYKHYDVKSNEIFAEKTVPVGN